MPNGSQSLSAAPAKTKTTASKTTADAQTKSPPTPTSSIYSRPASADTAGGVSPPPNSGEDPSQQHPFGNSSGSAPQFDMNPLAIPPKPKPLLSLANILDDEEQDIDFIKELQEDDHSLVPGQVVVTLVTRPDPTWIASPSGLKQYPSPKFRAFQDELSAQVALAAKLSEHEKYSVNLKNTLETAPGLPPVGYFTITLPSRRAYEELKKCPVFRKSTTRGHKHILLEEVKEKLGVKFFFDTIYDKGTGRPLSDLEHALVLKINDLDLRMMVWGRNETRTAPNGATDLTGRYEFWLKPEAVADHTGTPFQKGTERPQPTEQDMKWLPPPNIGYKDSTGFLHHRNISKPGYCQHCWGPRHEDPNEHCYMKDICKACLLGPPIPRKHTCSLGINSAKNTSQPPKPPQVQVQQVIPDEKALAMKARRLQNIRAARSQAEKDAQLRAAKMEQEDGDSSPSKRQRQVTLPYPTPIDNPSLTNTLCFSEDAAVSLTHRPDPQHYRNAPIAAPAIYLHARYHRTMSRTDLYYEFECMHHPALATGCLKYPNFILKSRHLDYG